MRATLPGAVGFVLFFDTPRLHSAAKRIALAKLIGGQAEKDMNRLSATATHQIYPPGFVGALPPDREKQLFEEMRLKGANADLPKKLIGYGSVGGYLAGMPQWVQRTLTAAGIEVESHELAYTAYQAKQKSLDHDYVVVMTGLNAKDPAGSLLTLLSPKSGIIPDPDGKLDGLLQQAVQAGPVERSALLHDLSEALLHDGRIVPFVHYGSSIVSSPDVIAEPPSQYDDELRLADIRWRD
jgi:MarR-like DNA-binding transcriptional regulator SgrR of sgrS sRNA